MNCSVSKPLSSCMGQAPEHFPFPTQFPRGFHAIQSYAHVGIKHVIFQRSAVSLGCAGCHSSAELPASPPTACSHTANLLAPRSQPCLQVLVHQAQKPVATIDRCILKEHF